jgi:hypothetical protein
MSAEVKIAERLAEYSDGRSGLGLLFLIVGKDGRDHKIVLSRIPTDSAIYVDETPGTLSVQPFIVRQLMIVQRDDRAVSHRQRCERTERSATTSASLRRRT